MIEGAIRLTAGIALLVCMLLLIVPVAQDKSAITTIVVVCALIVEQLIGKDVRARTIYRDSTD